MTNRRQFLKRLSAAGVLVATTQLPTWAEDKPKLFPKRGGYERLSLAYAMVHIGLEKPFSVLHISDTHLTAATDQDDERRHKLHENRSQTFGGRQEEALKDTLSWARDHVDYVVHTGDLIDWQSEGNYELVKKYFGDNIVGCMGNHEFSEAMWLSEPKEESTEAYKDRSRKRLAEVYGRDISVSSQVVNGLNFIAMDDVYGTFTSKQVKRFKKEVKKGLPIVLCLHVPLLTDDIWRATIRFWTKAPSRYTNAAVPTINGDYKAQKEDPVTRDFIAYLRQEPLLRCILAGHEHITVEDQFSPTCREYVVGPNFLFHGREVLFD